MGRSPDSRRGRKGGGWGARSRNSSQQQEQQRISNAAVVTQRCCCRWCSFQWRSATVSAWLGEADVIQERCDVLGGRVRGRDDVCGELPGQDCAGGW